VKTRASVLLALVGFLAMPRTAVAGHPETARLVLIVTNNRSLDLGRPDLRYADDDGAKYFELFSMIAPRGQVHLLTTFDEDTRKLFPDLARIARAPTRTNLDAAVRQLSDRARAERAAGRAVELFFVFAGHGDVDRGRGFLELADGPLNADDLAGEVLGQIPYTHAHVILDSCNSFFVINPRKPGGRRFATPDDAAASAAKRLPNVGVFLSTSAEAEVFEWSALQSGIFSHAVRSGLAGGADANADGAITYEELEAFVSTAAAEVRNPLFRPRVYARGPNGARDSTLFDLAAGNAPAVVLPTQPSVRVTIRDADELVWFDVFKEAGAALQLRLPARLAASASIDELTVDGAVARRRTAALTGTQHVALASLAVSAEPGSTAARGVDEVLRMLFARPFGPRALAAYRGRHPGAAAPVFGVAREDVLRMELLLSHTAGVDRQTHFVIAGAIAGIGATALLGGVWMLREPELSPLATTQTDTRRRVGWGLVAAGLAGVAWGGLSLLRPAPGQRVYRRFRSALAEGEDPLRVVADTELRLEAMLRREQRGRCHLQIAGWVVAAGSALGLVANEFAGPEAHRGELRLLLGAGVVAGVGGALVIRANLTPVERMVHIWQNDPGMRRIPRWSLLPTDGGAVVGVNGVF